MSEVMKRFAEQVALQQKVDFARKLLREKMSIEFVVRTTDLPLEEVQKLAEKRTA